MSKSINTLYTALLIASAGSAFAASSVDLSVQGLITPSACTPALSNGGLYEMGKIASKDLSADQPTYLPHHFMQLTVTCDASTLVAIAAKDNRLGSQYQDDTSEFGLGLINGDQKLGSLALRLLNPVADGVTVRAIVSGDSGETWSAVSWVSPDYITSVANNAAVAPVPVRALTADLRVWPIIAPTNGLTLTSEVPIDGSATLTVVYL